MAKDKNLQLKLKELKSLEKQLMTEPTNIALNVRYGKLLLKTGDTDKSEKVFQNIIKQDPSNIQAKQGLVEIYFGKQNYSTVIVISEELLHSNQATEKIRILHIKSLLKQNSIAEAQQLYNKLISENPFIFDDELSQVFEDTSDLSDDFFDDDEFENNPFSDDDDDDFDDDFDEEEFDKHFNDPEDVFEMLEEVLLMREGRSDFKNVLCMDAIKEHFKYKFDFFTKQDNHLSNFKRPLRASVMMYGPTGCGKTFIMNAFIREFLCPLIPLEVLEVKGFPSLDKQSLLAFAFNYASVIKPVTIFIDNIEAYAQKQTDQPIDITVKTLQCFEGLKYDLSEVGIVAASSKPWEIDPSLFRYGRMDDLVFAGPPSASERKIFFSKKLIPRNAPLKPHLNKIVDLTKGFTFAELHQVIERGIYYSTKAGGNPKTIKLEAMEDAAKSIDPVTKYWLEELKSNTDGNARLQHLFKEGLQYTVE